MQEPPRTTQSDMAVLKEPLNQVPKDKESNSSESQITEEQRARMEANRLKAQEKAAARARLLQAAWPFLPFWCMKVKAM